MKRYLKTFLALTFALLQCVAPIAHAHINGSSADTSIHLPDMVVQYSHKAALSNFDGAQESPAISASQGYERHDRAAQDDKPISLAKLARDAIDNHDAPRYLNPIHPLVLPSASFRKPFPQAPPAPLSL